MKKNLLCLCMLYTCCITASSQREDSLAEKQIYTSDFNIDEKPRLITFYIPEHYNNRNLCPVIFFLHDSAQNAKTVIKKYGDMVHATADASSAIVVYPDAINKSWNDYMNASNKDSINDAGFISIMMDYFVQRYHGDPDRIYVIGIGKGGAMAYNMSYNSHNRVDAIASVNGYLSDASAKQNKAAEPMPAIIFSDAKTNAGMLPGEAVTQYWLERNKVTAPAKITSLKDLCAGTTVEKTVYKSNNEIVVYKMSSVNNCISTAIKTSLDFLLSQKKQQ